jgi:large subunit ribosomal protein L9
MKVILLVDVPKVGRRNEIKEIKNGYAQNVLIAKGLAIMATPKSLADLEIKQKEMLNKKQKEDAIFELMVKDINNKKIILKSKANDKGVLFKAINQHDVAKAIKEQTGFEIDDKSIEDIHVKEIGIYKVKIKRAGESGICQIEVIKE